MDEIVIRGGLPRVAGRHDVCAISGVGLRRPQRDGRHLFQKQALGFGVVLLGFLVVLYLACLFQQLIVFTGAKAGLIL